MFNKLYDYWRSSSSARVRIVLALKNISYELIPISLLDDEQHAPDYLKLNPQGLVPFWQDEHLYLSQSLAIIEYLDAAYPEPKIIPEHYLLAAKARQYAYIIACDMHPLNNLRVKKYMNLSEEQWLAWYHHWLQLGFDAYEHMLSQGPFTLGKDLSLADICLAPQVYNAKRFKFNMSNFPKIMGIYEQCLELDAFKQAMPKDFTSV